MEQSEVKLYLSKVITEHLIEEFLKESNFLKMIWIYFQVDLICPVFQFDWNIENKIRVLFKYYIGHNT